MGNTQSIPSFSIPCLEAKSFAVSSCRFAQSSPMICANFRRKIESQKKQNVKVLKTKAPPKTFPTGGASRRGSFFPNLPPRGRGTAAAAVRRAANLISYSCQWQLYHNLWMRGVAGVSCRKYARSKAPLAGEPERVFSDCSRPLCPSSVSLTRASSTFYGRGALRE